jgi:secretion/DNA translocation related CpaE-like protein
VAAELADLGPPRRPGVHVVGWGPVPDEAFRVAVRLGAENVAELPRSDQWLLEALADAGERAVRDAVTIGVVGGSGGAGATTFACALAVVAARHGPACLLDADPQGPGADQVLGFDRTDGVRWDALQQTTGRLSARALHDALPRRNQLGVLTWSAGPQGPLPAFAAREAMSAAVRGHDVVVVDLPRSADPVTEELAARCRHLVVVARSSIPGYASAARLVSRLSASGPVGAVVRGPAVDERDAGAVLGVPVLTTMGDQRGLDEAIDLGLGPLRSRRSVLGRAAARVLATLHEGGAVAGGRAA